jgi:hypothetical protein
MAIDLATHFSLLDDLDARQNAVLDQLDELDRRVASLLSQYTSSVPLIQVPGLADRAEQSQAEQDRHGTAGDSEE